MPKFNLKRGIAGLKREAKRTVTGKDKRFNKNFKRGLATGAALVPVGRAYKAVRGARGAVSKTVTHEGKKGAVHSTYRGRKLVSRKRTKPEKPTSYSGGRRTKQGKLGKPASKRTARSFKRRMKRK